MLGEIFQFALNTSPCQPFQSNLWICLGSYSLPVIHRNYTFHFFFLSLSLLYLYQCHWHIDLLLWGSSMYTVWQLLIYYTIIFDFKIQVCLQKVEQLIITTWTGISGSGHQPNVTFVVTALKDLMYSVFMSYYWEWHTVCQALVFHFFRWLCGKLCVVFWFQVIDQNNGMYRCEKCNREYPNFKYRLLLSVSNEF
jgi:hypothetical protein